MRSALLTSALLVGLVMPVVDASYSQESQDLLLSEALQLSLVMLGYDPGPIDGIIGPRTLAALAQYQVDRGLASLGYFDEPTANTMLRDLGLDPIPPSGHDDWDLNASNDYSDPSPFTAGLGTQNVLGAYPGDSGIQPLPTVYSTGAPAIFGEDGEYLGGLSANPYSPNSVSNPYGTYGSKYSPSSVNNPYSGYGSPYSVNGARNPYTTGGARIFGSDGTYLGRLNANPYDPESVSNPYGTYGSPYSPYTINNPYGIYGSPYSPQSATNPYATDTFWDQ